MPFMQQIVYNEKNEIPLGISFFLAGVCSALGRIFKPLRSFFVPVFAIVRTLPTMAVLVLILIYTNVTIAPIIVACLVLFPMIYAQFNVAFDGVDQGLISAMKIFKLNKKQKLFKVYLPIIFPPILSHFGANLSFGIKLVISAEVMANTFTSLGGMMQNANGLGNVAELTALTLVAVLLGLLIELLLNLITLNAFKWTKKEGVND